MSFFGQNLGPLVKRLQQQIKNKCPRMRDFTSAISRPMPTENHFTLQFQKLAAFSQNIGIWFIEIKYQSLSCMLADSGKHKTPTLKKNTSRRKNSK